MHGGDIRLVSMEGTNSTPTSTLQEKVEVMKVSWLYLRALYQALFQNPKAVVESRVGENYKIVLRAVPRVRRLLRQPAAAGAGRDQSARPVQSSG